MARKPNKKNPRTDAEPVDDDLLPDIEDRDEELGDRPELQEALLDLYREVEKGLQNQWDRANSTMDYWDIYNCKLGSKQYYSGNSQIFLPIVHDAVNARVIRFTNQLFPQGGRYVDVTSMDGEKPFATMALVEHYIRKCKLRTQVVPSLIRNGDVEGQYNVYVSWREKKRRVVFRVQKPLAPGIEQAEDIEEETVSEGRPVVEVLADSDVCIVPNTCDSADDAVRLHGGSVTILRRWSKSKIKKMIAAGEIMKEAGKQLCDEMVNEKSAVQTNKPKQMSDAAGIRTTGGTKFALVYETWTELTIPPPENREGEDAEPERRICRVFFGSEKLILGCKRNPNWSDKLPLFTASVDKVQGSIKGMSKVQPVEQTQYYANDVINEAADSSMYALMPIIMTDPEKNPRIGSMVLSLAAVWEADPNSTRFAQFPDLWKSGFEIVASCKAQIFQTLSVSPAAITQAMPKSKPSQADVAREQQVDILTTAEAVSIIEEGVLTPMVNFMVELDHQHRKDKLLVRQFGDMGVRAKMEYIDPIQMDKKWSLQWLGVENARNQMKLQQQIAGIATIMKIPPQLYKGHRLNLVPVITNMVENLFGPRLAPLVFVDESKEVTLEPQLENEWLTKGVELAVHPMDQDAEHVQVHQQALQTVPDGAGVIRRHIQRHMVQMHLKQQAMLAQQVQQMMGGGGPPAGPGPRAGAQQRGARGNGQGPAGMVHRDQIGPQAGAMPQLRQPGGM